MSEILKFDNQLTVEIVMNGQTEKVNYRYPTFTGHFRTGNLLWKIMNEVYVDVIVDGKKHLTKLIEAWRTQPGTKQPIVTILGPHYHKPTDFITTTADPDWPAYVRSHTPDKPNKPKPGNDDQKS